MKNRFQFLVIRFKKVKFVTFHSFCFSVLRNMKETGLQVQAYRRKNREDFYPIRQYLKNIYEK